MKLKLKGDRFIFLMKKINLSPLLCLFSAVLLLIQSCNGSNDSKTEPLWTVMVYMAGDNNLSTDLLKDLGEMEAVGSTGRVNVVVQIDTLGGGARRLLVKRGSSSLLEDLGEQNMASPQTLRDFVVWAKTSFPAPQNALILSSHGDGLAKRIPLWPDRTQAKILQDDTDGVSCCLSNVLVRQALEDAGLYIDLLGFDASQMGQVETAYEFRNVADILVFSQETGQANGWDYTAILRALTVNPSMENDELAGVIVNSYKSFYETVFYPQNPDFEQYLTISAIRMGGTINDLAVEVNELSGLMILGLINDGLGVQRILLDTIAAARGESQELTPYITPYVYVDLIDLISNMKHMLENQANPPLILKLISSEMEEILAMEENVILSEYHGHARPDSNGLSIVFFRLPKALDFTYDTNYKDFDPQTGEGMKVQFINDTSWDEFLHAYYDESGLL